MTWKEFKKRAAAIWKDNRSCFSMTKEHAPVTAGRNEVDCSGNIVPWFCCEEYVNACWLKKIWLCLVFILRDKRGESEIPAYVIKEVARCLLPDIIAFCESEEGKRAFEEWEQRKTNMGSVYCAFESNKMNTRERGDGQFV